MSWLLSSGRLRRAAWWVSTKFFSNHGVRDVVRALIDVTRRPAPHPVLYLRCGDCGKVAPRTSLRHHTGWCLLCDAYSPRVVGDQVDPDDPDVETVTMTCTARFGCFQLWRRCENTFTAPAAATVVRCTACGQRYPAFGEERAFRLSWEP